MKRNNLLIIIVLVLLITFNFISAIPQTISIQGKLTNSSNNALSGTYNMIFKIYNVSTGGSALYSASQSLNTDSNGIYNAILNDINLTFTEQYFLGIQVESDAEMSPRINLTSSPYAFRANNSDYWNNLNATNSTQFENNNGLLHLVESWFESKWNSLFRNWNNQDLNITSNVSFKNISSSGVLSVPQICLDGDCRSTWPTGTGGSGIIASGNNSNGYYIQFADGTMMQWGNTTFSVSTLQNSNIGTYGWSYYLSTTAPITFPVAFTSNPNVVSSTTAWTSSVGSITTTGFNVNLQNDGSSTSQLNWYAIGRWTTLTNITQNTTSWAVNANGNVVLFDTTKNVGIGTTSPSNKLEVIGNTNITGNLTLGIGKIMYNSTTGSYYYNNGTSWYAFGTGASSGTGLSNYSNFSNYSYYWGNSINSTNSTQIGVTNGVLSVLESWLTTFWNSLFRNWNNQNLNTTNSPTFVNLTLTGNLSVAGGGYISYNSTGSQYIYYNGSAWLPFGSGSGSSSNGIVASGNNSNGYYIQFADGTMIQRGSIDIAMNTGTGSGAIFFPVAFIPAGVISSIKQYSISFAQIAQHGDYNAGTTAFGLGSGNESYINLLAKSDLTSSFTVTVAWQAIGRWTAVPAINSSIYIGIPYGAIMAFNSASCPAGWIIADGTSGTPDLRGIFIRGAGTSGVLKWANGTYMNAGFGTYGNDSFQGHWHQVRESSGVAQLWGAGATPSGYTVNIGANVNTANPMIAQSIITDSINGVPRNGSETSPAYYVLTYCMKTAGDSQASNSIWATSGNTIIVNNQSNNLSLQNTSTIYYAPNASEPSLGTPHPHEYQINDSVQYPIGTMVIDLSSQVPVGTTQVYVTGIFQSATLNAEVKIKSTSGIIACHSYLQGLTSVATLSGIVRLDANRKFNVTVITATVTMYEFQMHEYWI